MKTILNFQLIENEANVLNVQNRAFQYGDGLFETMIFEDDKIRFLSDHFERLSGGCQVLKIKLSENLTIGYLEKAVRELVSENQIVGSSRIRLQVWRKSGGLYTPQSYESEFYISVQPFENQSFIVRTEAVFLDEPRLHFSKYSRFKTCNALPYVLAGIAKKELNTDEVILLDNQGFIAECSSSNLFWLKENTLFTPALETGCLAGIMRKQIIQKAKFLKMSVIEGFFSKEDFLENAETVFTSNVTGIYLIREIEDKTFNVSNFPEWLRNL